MEKLVIFPLMLMLVSGLAFQLNDIAERTSQKSIAFTSDVNDAMECALWGIDIEECSPNLIKDPYEFEEELKALREVSDQIIREVDTFEPIEYFRVEEGDSFSIKYAAAHYVVQLSSADIAAQDVIFMWVDLDDMLTRNMEHLIVGEPWAIDIDGDVSPDAKLVVTQVSEEGILLEVTLVKGEITPLDLSLVLILLLLFFLLFHQFIHKEKRKI